MVCVVTGASSGIGRAVAKECATRGASLVISGRNQERLASAKQECENKGAFVHEIVGDVSDSKHCADLFSAATDIAREEQIAAVFAAGYASFGPTLESKDAAWHNTIASTLTGLFFSCRAAIKVMLPRGGGRIVNVLSIAAKMPFPGGAAYVAAKHGGLGLTAALSQEFRSQGIQLTAFMPGSVDTPLWDSMSSAPERSDMLSADEVADAIANIIFSNSKGTFDEVVYMPRKGFL